MEGAITGTKMKTAITKDMTLAISGPLYRSRMTAFMTILGLAIPIP